MCVNSSPLLDISILPSQNFHISVFLSFISQWYPQPANLKWSIIYCLSFAMFIFFTAHCEIRDIVSFHLFFFHSEEWPDSLRMLLPSLSSSIPYYYKPEKITLTFWDLVSVYKMRTVLFGIVIVKVKWEPTTEILTQHPKYRKFPIIKISFISL